VTYVMVILNRLHLKQNKRLTVIMIIYNQQSQQPPSSTIYQLP